MPVVWSFNTTVRNPERMQNFLRTLQEFSGRIFDENCQSDFFARQIQKRLYKPTNGKLGYDNLLMSEINKENAEEIPDDILGRIMRFYQGNADASLRGRTTVAALSRFGLCIANKSHGPVIITELGNKWLNYEIEDQELFFKFLLKWQYPNPIEDGYNNFNVKPFIATLSLIDFVNRKWTNKGYTSVGLDKIEFMLFATSLRDYRNIESYADRIIDYRIQTKQRNGRDRSNFEDNFVIRRIREIFGEKADLRKSRGALKDYTDSAIRYFRMTGFVSLRGSDTHIDLAPDHKVEIDTLIQKDNAGAQEYTNFDDYLNFLINTSLPALPWENESDLNQIKTEVININRSLIQTLEKNKTDFECLVESIASLSLVKQIEKLNENKNNLQIEKLRKLAYNSGELDEIIKNLTNLLSSKTRIVTSRPSLDLEWFVSLSLMVLNDAKSIFPSYKLGDDGLPTGFKSNISDIECLYHTFGMTVEVTLLMGRDQWIAEGQPVMRHLRDFEDKYCSYGENTFCLFIAPYIHRDTLNIFWGVIKQGGYEGKSQRIIPLKIEQFVKILSFVNLAINQDRIPSHEKYYKLFHSLYAKCLDIRDSTVWINTFDSAIESWGNSLITYEN